jgi:hypothetical protein
VLTIGIVSTPACRRLGLVALATRSFRWEGFRGTEDTANHLVGALLMGVGGVTAWAAPSARGCRACRRWRWAASSRWRHHGRRRAGAALADLAAGAQPVTTHAVTDEADLERRFGGLRRLYGDAGYARMRAARIAVVGLGGVGSWAAEALARSGVAELVLFDLDHVAESNINRQVQALGPRWARPRTQALAERIADIHPGCRCMRSTTSCSPTTGRRCCRRRWTC